MGDDLSGDAGRRQPPSGSGRLLAFSDGVFAIAFTILVLDLVVPPGLPPDELRAAVADMLPNLLGAALSFAVIGRFWLAHHELFDHVRVVDTGVLVLNTVLLALIALVPSVTALLGEYGDRPLAVVGYSVVVGAAAATDLALWVRVTRRRLLGPDLTDEARLGATYGIAAAAFGFLVAIPVALLSPRWGMVCWLIAALPVPRSLTRRGA